LASTFSNLLFHLVFTTRNRYPYLRPELREPLYQYIGGTIRSARGVLLEIGGVADHVHLLVQLKPETAVAAMVRLIKSNSSRWINDQPGRQGRFEWQNGYGVFTVSESQVQALRAYILNQEEHHAHLSFADELAAILRKNRVGYDERYWLG
jgi:putative transposase